jgi:Cu/Ag efflux protein CusF
MKKTVVMVVLVAAFLVVAGAAFAAEMMGTVSAMDMGKNTITIKGEKMDAAFDCETGTILTGIKVGDQVTVQYDEAGGKKRATKITPMHKKPKAAVGC